MPVSIDDMYEQKLQIEANRFQPKEAYNRLVISRGYYASFSYACELVENKKNNIRLIKKDASDNNYGTHQCYFESLIACDYEELVEVGNKLISYHKLRKKSDYQLKKHVTDLDVKVANQYLEECKVLMDSFMKNKLNPSLTFNPSTIITT